MNKLMTVVAASVCAASFSATAFADADAPDTENKADAKAMEEEEDSIFEFGLDVDFFSAYVWRHMVQTDQPVLQPCVWADLTCFEPFWFGFSYWQNWDLSNDRMSASSPQFTRRLNEVDYNVHAGVTAWESDDRDMSLEFELGHEWFTYHNVNTAQWEKEPTARELYLKGKFANPVVDVYGQVSWDYNGTEGRKNGFYYELGLNKEFELCDALTLGLDWSAGALNGNYMEMGYGTCLLGTTLKSYLAWAVTDWMSIVGTIAYTGLLDSELRGDADDAYDRDLLWGGISAKFAF